MLVMLLAQMGHKLNVIDSTMQIGHKLNVIDLPIF